MRRVRRAIAAVVATGLGCATAPPRPLAGVREPIQRPLAPPEAPVQDLLQGLDSTEPSVRAASAWGLAGVRDAPAEVRERLLRLSSDPDRSVRYGVAWALGHIDTSFNSGPDQTPPKLIAQTKPRYPPAAFAAWVEGTVLIELLIGELGEVVHADVRRSIPELDAAALDCVRQWRFEPRRVSGAPRAVVAHAPVVFSIYLRPAIGR